MHSAPSAMTFGRSPLKLCATYSPTVEYINKIELPPFCPVFVSSPLPETTLLPLVCHFLHRPPRAISFLASWLLIGSHKSTNSMLLETSAGRVDQLPVAGRPSHLPDCEQRIYSSVAQTSLQSLIFPRFRQFFPEAFPNTFPPPKGALSRYPASESPLPSWGITFTRGHARSP